MAQSWAFGGALEIIIRWPVTTIEYSDTWQLQLKLDELIRSTSRAHNALLDLVELTQNEVNGFLKIHRHLADEGGKGAGRDREIRARRKFSAPRHHGHEDARNRYASRVAVRQRDAHARGMPDGAAWYPGAIRFSVGCGFQLDVLDEARPPGAADSLRGAWTRRLFRGASHDARGLPSAGGADDGPNAS
jgi:hypothetical protein